MTMEIWGFLGHMPFAFLHLTSPSMSYLFRLWRMPINPWQGVNMSGNPIAQCNALTMSSSLCLKIPSSQSNKQAS